MRIVGYICTFATYLFLSALWRGYVLSVLWGWFIIGLFPGAPALSIASALGIAMTVSYLTYNRVPDSSKGDRSMTERLVEAGLETFLTPFFALVFGAIVHAFL